ncbi:MAG: hypothetical protein A2V66_03520 [Ignavibacteria bacterium RBG_13_36_8]|nr:MAG: hypothetical protein A2V66_03520 [Ignavibacteria bacterium RBG_13_36_8]
MKHLFLISIVILFFAACTNESENTPVDITRTISVGETANFGNVPEGALLVKYNGFNTDVDCYMFGIWNGADWEPAGIYEGHPYLEFYGKYTYRARVVPSAEHNTITITLTLET